MNMHPKKYIDATLLYELSLAVGQSLDVRENCACFLTVLEEKMHFNKSSIWIKNEDHFKLIFSTSNNITSDNIVKTESSFFKKLESEDFFILKKEEAGFEKINEFENSEEGDFVIFKLDDFGFLCLNYCKDAILNEEDFQQLIHVIKKLSIVLKGSIAHEKLLQEREQRLFVQRALNVSREKHRLVIRNLSEGIIITNLKGLITFVNKRMEILTGYSHREMVGKSVYERLVNPTMHHILRERLSERKEGKSDEYTLEFINKSGEIWLGKIMASPFKNSEGEIIGAIGAVTDITAQHQAEVKLKTSENMLRKIIDTSLDALVNINTHGEIVLWSNQATRIFGYTSEEAIGEKIEDLLIPLQYKERYLRLMEFFRKTGSNSMVNNRLELNAIDKFAKEFPIELSISSIEMNGEHLFSGFIRDITERKKAEQELISAKLAAEQAQVAEQQFLANMSHEIRTPMNAVIGMTHLLYETNPSAVQKEYIDSLRFSADSLMGIISNILDLSKIEANALEFENRTFSLLSLLKSLQQTFQLKVHDKPVEVVIECDPNIENNLIGDSVRLTQILTNLLGNAGKFTQEGMIGIRTKLLESSKEKYLIQFQIHDTGIGIDPESIDKIFENFKQANVQIARKFGGTGLGLTIVKQLVELQGGSISVESAKLKGSTFTITLPFQNSGILQSELIETEEFPSANSMVFKDTKILIVEDNPMNQKLIIKIMELWNCPFEMASSGFIALEKTRTEKFDLILMDVHMPEMDGCETTNIIRLDNANLNQNTPIIALTAAALLKEKKRALEAGMNDFLTKPIVPNQLKTHIAKWIQLEEQPQKEEVIVEEKSSNDVEINFSYLMETSQGDEGFIKEMIGIFLREIPLAMQDFDQEFENQNWEKVMKTAHRIKINYMMVGMSTQQELALAIEKKIKTNEFSSNEILSMIKTLQRDSEAAYPVLEKELSLVGSR